MRCENILKSSVDVHSEQINLNQRSHQSNFRRHFSADKSRLPRTVRLIVAIILQNLNLSVAVAFWQIVGPLVNVMYSPVTLIHCQAQIVLVEHPHPVVTIKSIKDGDIGKELCQFPTLVSIVLRMTKNPIVCLFLWGRSICNSGCTIFWQCLHPRAFGGCRRRTSRWD